VKYKLQAAMELGILEDDRRAPPEGDFVPSLTPIGRELRSALEPHLAAIDLSFQVEADGIPSTRMRDQEEMYNALVRSAVRENPQTAALVYRTVLRMHAVQQMLAFLYHVCREPSVERDFIYANFFQAPFVKQFMDQEGIEEATIEASKRRCPFLLNLLNAVAILELERKSVKVNSLLLVPPLVRPYAREEEEASVQRLKRLEAAWPDREELLPPDDLSVLRELFGPDFLTERYPLKTAIFMEEL
jgi:hypothetical protein